MSKHVSKAEKIQQSKKMIEDFELTYTSHNMNLHWKIPVKNYIMDFYPTTHTWVDMHQRTQGKGIQSFLSYIGKVEPWV
jgi:hypothetical protein